MSNEVIARIRQAYPDDPRSDEDLTLALGELWERSGRADIFEANPGFASAYRELRNDIRRNSDQRGALAQLRDAVMRGVGRARQAFNVATDSGESQAADIVAAQEGIDARPVSPEFAEFMEGRDKGFVPSALELLRNPKVAAEVVAESAPQSVLSMGAGALGTFLGGLRGLRGGPTGAAVGAFVGAGSASGAVEAANKVLDVLQESGMDIRDPESVQRFFADESQMAKARELALKRGVAVGVFDGASMAIAGRFARPLLEARAAGQSASLGRAALATGQELGTQAALGGLGERAGQIAAGEEYSGRDIALEAVAEIASSPGEIASNLSMARRVRPPSNQRPEARPLAAPIASPDAGIFDQPDTEGASTPFDEYVNDPVQAAAQAAKQALAAVREQEILAEREAEAAELFEQQQDEINRQLAAARAREILSAGAAPVAAPEPVIDELSAGLALAGAERAVPSELEFMALQPTPPDMRAALAMAGADRPGIFEASRITNPDAGLFEQEGRDGMPTPVDRYISLRSPSLVRGNGEGKIVYHGTSNAGFQKFDPYLSEYGLFGEGAYFTEDPEVASSYTGKGRGDSKAVYPVRLSIKNPINMDEKADIKEWKAAIEKAHESFGQANLRDGMTNEQAYRELEEALAGEFPPIPKYEGAAMMKDFVESMGYDGITHVGGGRAKRDGTKHRVWIAFHPEQIASAFDNRSLTPPPAKQPVTMPGSLPPTPPVSTPSPPPLVPTLTASEPIPAAQAIRTFDDAAMPQAERVAEVLDFVKDKQPEYSVAVILQDNATGNIYQRGVRRGRGSMATVEMAQVAKGSTVGPGQRRAAEADLDYGEVSRPLDTLLAEKNGETPRFTVLGYTTLAKPQKSAAINFGPAANFQSHPDVQRLVKAGYDQAVLPARTTGRRPSTNKKTGVVAGSAAAGDLDVGTGITPEVASVAAEQPTVTAVSPSVQLAEAIAAEAAKRGREGAIEYTQKILAQMAKQRDVKVVAPPEIFRAAAERLVDDAVAMTMRPSDTNLVPDVQAPELFASALRSVRDAGGDVVLFERNAASRFEAAQKGWGVITEGPQRQKLIGLGVQSLHGRHDATVKLLHEIGHMVSDRLPEAVRRALHLSIDRLHWSQQQWALNPLSTEIRVLANADPAALSPEQRKALASFTPEEIARARNAPREEIVREQMAEHLAMLGVAKAEAKGLIDRIVRLFKGLLLELAIAFQQTLKGEGQIAPYLARAYAENQFLSFIHGDTRAWASPANFFGTPATLSQRVTAYAALADGDFREVSYDPITREVLPPEISADTEQALGDKLDFILRRAEDFVRRQAPGTDLTQRADTVDYTPGVQFDSEVAAINLVEQHLRQIFEGEVNALLPRIDDPALAFQTFLAETLGLPKGVHPESLRAVLANRASTARDPITNQPVAYNPQATVDGLPAVAGQISSAQQSALRQSLRSLQQVEARALRKFASNFDRIKRLSRQDERNTLSEEGRAELDEINREQPILEKVLRGDTGLRPRIREIQSKLGGSMNTTLAPGSEYPVPPSPTAKPEQVLANRKVIPRDLKFADDKSKQALLANIVAIRDWLDNPDNRKAGSVYGHMQDVLARLQNIAVTPTDTANTFRLHKTMTRSIVGMLRGIGTPVAVAAGKTVLRFQALVDSHRAKAYEIGAKWQAAMADYAKATGEPFNEAFFDRHWNPLMRALESINEGAGNPFELAEQAMAATAGVKIGAAQRPAFRALILATRDADRFYRGVFESMGLKVSDPDLLDEKDQPLLRNLIAQGYVTGRRSVSRHILSLYQEMNPVWTEGDNPAVANLMPKVDADGKEIDLSFMANAALLYTRDRPVFDEQMARFFTPAVVRDFVEPLALNNSEHFLVKDNGMERAASLSNVRAAWREAKGDVTKFAEALHRRESLPAGQEAQTVQSVLRDLTRVFAEIKADSDQRLEAERNNMETTPRQMMDARLSSNWPAAWVSYGAFDASSNLRLLHQLAVNAAFGRNGFGPNGEFTAQLNAIISNLHDLQREERRLRREQNLGPKEIAKAMGEDRYKIALQAPAHLDMLEQLRDTAFKAVTKTTGYLVGDFRLVNELVAFSAGMALQNPRSAALQVFDVLAPFFKYKFSSQAFQASFRALQSTGAGLVNSVLQAVGANYAVNADAARRRILNGYRDPEVAVSFRDHFADRGYRMSLAQPDHPESLLGKSGRLGLLALRRMRDLTNLGPVADPSKALGPKLRPGLFGTVSEALYAGSIDAACDTFADLASRGVEWLSRMSAVEREAVLRDLDSGVFTPAARDLGYHRKWGVLNDEAAYAYLKDALESKLYGESGLGQFIAGVWRRKQAGQPELTDHQFRQIASLAMGEFSLQSSLATSPAALFTSPALRILSIFLVWPWNAMTRFADSFRDPRGRITGHTILDGSVALIMGALPLTLAGSLAFDWYDERILGKKQNLRELNHKDLPLAALERFARYGGAGLAGELVNQLANYDTTRNLSLDNRIFAVNQMRNVWTGLETLVQQEGTFTYASVGRPLIQSVGGSGFLHAMQLVNNWIPGVSGEDEAINRRINAGNYLRAAGRALDLDVRVFRGAQQVPTPVTPWLQQMEMAAIAGDNRLFERAYQRAVRAAMEMDPPKADPRKYVADAFADRHPLRRIFTHAPSTYDYRRILGHLDEPGRKAVGEGVNNFNRQLQRLGKDPYLGRVTKAANPDAMLRNIERQLTGASVNTFEY
jgi:hypothetical protein